LPGLLLVVLLLAWASEGGGYAATDWYPGALFLLGLLAVMALADGGTFAKAARSNAIAVGIFAAFAAWSLLSILWANAKDDAWDGGNRVFMYLIVFAIVGLVPATPHRSAVVLGAFSLGVTVLTALTFFLGDPGETFSKGRLAEPIGYANATAALCLMAVWPAITLALAREVPMLLRGLMLGSAAVLLQLAVLAESRGAVFALPLAAIVYLALVPSRARVLLAFILLGVAGFLTWDTLTAVYAGVRADSSSALMHARAVVAATFAALVTVGALLAFVDRRLSVSDALARRGARVFELVVVVALLAGGGLWVASVGNPVDRAEAAWQDFNSGHPDSFGNSRFTGELGTNRSDFWRVGLEMFRERPVLGAGADNFALKYARERRTHEEPTYPHSIAVEVLSQTGGVGAALLATAWIAALVAFARKRRARGSFGNFIAAAAMAGFVYWLIHASADWFWELPVLGAAGLMFLGIAMVVSTPAEVQRKGDWEVPPWARVVGFLVCLAATLSFIFPWLSARAIDDALAIWRADPQLAQTRLAQARQLNPVSDQPDLIAGVIAGRTGDVATMREAFERAIQRNPENWYAHFELGIAYALSKDDPAALAELEVANELNPREPLIDEVQSDVRAGRPVSPSGIDRRFLARAEAVLR
jgi:tetratricopeptide (TPR) repeat protein